MQHTSHIADLVGGIVALLIIAVATLALSKKLRLPNTVILVVMGIALAQFALKAGLGIPVLHDLELSPDLILYVFLPALVFDSALHLNPRSLRHNIGPILALAIPGVLLSTSLIGLIVWLATPIPLIGALLLGAILSATDPVAVVSLFRQLGAPERLTTLLEGESLFNDATAIVLTRLLIGVIAAGSLSGESLTTGILDFFILFFGGLLVGAALGFVVAFVIGLVESDPLIEIPLTTALAYLSFLVAEQQFGVSGVMATVGAGLVIGGWGKVKVSPSVQVYLENFWGQMAFVANALIFLMLGLKVEPQVVWHSLDQLPWVILAMIVSRAVLIYGMTPWVSRLHGGKPLKIAYQTVMFWGGLRGAIAIALVLSLPQLPYTENLVVLVTGAVLFTLLVQGLTIEPLIKWLQLDKPTLIDRIMKLERDLETTRHAFQRIQQLSSSGLFSSRILHTISQQCRITMQAAKHAIQKLRQHELGVLEETALLYLRALSEEKVLYQRLFAEGHLSEGALRELNLVVTLQIDAIRFHGSMEHIQSHRIHRLMEQKAYRLFDRFKWLAPLAEHFRMARLIRNYEEIWGHHQGSEHVLRYLKEIEQLEAIPKPVITHVREHYQRWYNLSHKHLDQVSEQFPEFANSMQERFGKRLLLLAQEEAIRADEARGLLSQGHSEALTVEIEHQLNKLRGQTVKKLYINAEQLLQRVPLFHGLDAESIRQAAGMLRKHTCDSGEEIIRQGEKGDSLYLIARGVVRVSHSENGKQKDLGTLIAGDFFGEMALMQHESRNATIRTVTPCQLYELKRNDLEKLMQENECIRETLKKTDQQRREEMGEKFHTSQQQR